MSALDKLFGRGNVTYHIAVAEALDSVAAAIFAEQIAFWQDRSEDGWAFRTTEEIQEYTGLKRKAQEGARKALRNAEVMEEVRRGVPARLYYRIDLDELANLIEETDDPVSTNVQTRSPDRTNYIEGEVEGGLEENGGSSEARSNGNRTPSQIITDMFYEGLQEAYGVDLEKSQYGFHLGHFKRVLDKATAEEQQRVLAHMIKNFPNAPKINAATALQDVKLGRDDGSAWDKPAPWEEAKQKNGGKEKREYDKHDGDVPESTKQLMKEIGLG